MAIPRFWPYQWRRDPTQHGHEIQPKSNVEYHHFESNAVPFCFVCFFTWKWIIFLAVDGNKWLTTTTSSSRYFFLDFKRFSRTFDEWWRKPVWELNNLARLGAAINQSRIEKCVWYCSNTFLDIHFGIDKKKSKNRIVDMCLRINIWLIQSTMSGIYKVSQERRADRLSFILFSRIYTYAHETQQQSNSWQMILKKKKKKK